MGLGSGLESSLAASPSSTSDLATSKEVCQTPLITGRLRRLAASLVSECRQTISRPLEAEDAVSFSRFVFHGSALRKRPPCATSPPNQSRQPSSVSAEGRLRMMPLVNPSSCVSSRMTHLLRVRVRVGAGVQGWGQG